jgi:hypothetical protein
MAIQLDPFSECDSGAHAPDVRESIAFDSATRRSVSAAKISQSVE